MTDRRPLVSIGIPAYNGEAFLGAAIESVLSQSLQDLELLVVDDCSSDGTLGLAEASADPRVRVLRNPLRLGFRGNWNRVLAEARGTFLKLLPQDDILFPDCLQKQLDVFLRPGNEEVALVCCARDIIDGSGRRLLRRSFRGRPGLRPGPEAVRASIRAGTNLIGEPGAVLFKTALASVVGGFDDAQLYVIDLDYWCRILLRGSLCIIPEALCAFRVAAGSASLRIAREQSRDFRKFVRRLRDDGRFNLNRGDALRGVLMATLNGWLRQLFYKVKARTA